MAQTALSMQGTARDAVAQAWCHLLDRDSLDADSSFEVAGGDSLALLKLIAEIEQLCGMTLPLGHFHVEMTPTAVAAAVDAILDGGPPASGPAPSVGRVSSAVLIREGRTQPPVFIAHGLGGHAGELVELGKRLAGDHPVFALQARGIGLQTPVECIEELAEEYLAALTTLQPRGPYLLIGYSIGGLVIFELACRLVAGGERVALLALLETYPNRRFWPLKPWLAYLMGRVVYHTRAIRSLPPHRVIRYGCRRARSLAGHIVARCGGPPQWAPPIADTRSEELKRMRKALMAASGRYRPAPYSGTVTFVKPEIQLWGYPKNPLSVWRGLAQDFEVVTVPGDHATMCMAHADALASRLVHYIDRALAAEV
jgi:acetoacetyl-CoA synthetase